MKDEELGRVKILRFDPNVDEGPRYVIYEIPYRGMTVLQALKHIYENLDPTLSFRFGCGGPNQGRCGACALVVNGKPVLSCQKVAEKEMTVEPHFKFKLIKDLVTDLNYKTRGKVERKSSVMITVDSDKCTSCCDCVFICRMGVWEVKRAGGRVTVSPLDMQSCCGFTCMQCAMLCQHNAITVIN